MKLSSLGNNHSFLDTLRAQTEKGTKEDNYRLITQIREGTPLEKLKAEQKLVLINMPLVLHSLKNYLIRWPDAREDLIQLGMIGLMEAVDRFDLESGNSLSTMAIPYIIKIARRYHENSTETFIPTRTIHVLNLMNKARDQIGWSPDKGGWPEFRKWLDGYGAKYVETISEVTYKKALAVPTFFQYQQYQTEDDEEILDVLASDKDVVETIIFEDGVKKLERLVDTLPERDRDLMVEKYGLKGGNEVPRSILQLKYGMTGEGVRQVEVRSLKRLRQSTADRSVSFTDF